jgi:hypothetical protein
MQGHAIFGSEGVTGHGAGLGSIGPTWLAALAWDVVRFAEEGGQTRSSEAFCEIQGAYRGVLYAVSGLLEVEGVVVIKDGCSGATKADTVIRGAISDSIWPRDRPSPSHL